MEFDFPLDSASKSEITLDTDTICIYLPPSPGGYISDHEDDAKPFCNTNKPPGVKGHVDIIPDGLLASSHFKSGDGFVQYTGRINPGAYKLHSDDEGGQYDSVGAPPGAKCVGHGFVKFVSLIEPKDKRFCIRCCSDASKCNTGESTEGCPTVIPGNYK
ncbi:16_t:CDS:2 [Entrophospora sp. SA101]|nr:16_t:CDS:2 [Entrophospora sp. SA101]